MFWALTHCLFSNFRKRCLNIWKHLIETLEEAHPSLPANCYKNPCYLFCIDHFVSNIRVVFLRSIARSFKYEVLDNKNCFKEALKCTVWPALHLLQVQNRKVRTDGTQTHILMFFLFPSLPWIPVHKHQVSVSNVTVSYIEKESQKKHPHNSIPLCHAWDLYTLACVHTHMHTQNK